MADNFILGKDAKLYYNATLLTANPSDFSHFTNVADNVKDVTVNLETGSSDITTRANNGWKASASTTKDGTVEFESVWKPGDAGFDAIRTAWANSTEIALAALTEVKTSETAEGLVGNFVITNFSLKQPLEEAQTVSVTAKPSSFTLWLPE